MNSSPTHAPPPPGTMPPGTMPLDRPAGPPAPAGPAGRGEARAEPRPLRRRKDGKILAGVCAGLGRYLGLDPVLLRVAFVVLTLANGIGILVYVIAAIVIPSERPGEPVGAALPADAALGRLVVGGVLVTAGALLLLDQFVSVAGRVFWPLAVAAIGLAILLKGVRR